MVVRLFQLEGSSKPNTVDKAFKLGLFGPEGFGFETFHPGRLEMSDQVILRGKPEFPSKRFKNVEIQATLQKVNTLRLLMHLISQVNQALPGVIRKYCDIPVTEMMNQYPLK